MLYAPASLVTAVVVTPVSVLVAVIDTPGIEAFDVSSTVPVSPPFPVWANTFPNMQTSTSNPDTALTTKSRFICDLLSVSDFGQRSNSLICLKSWRQYRQ